MIASNQIKGLLAGFAAVAFIGTAMAQGSPPNPAIKSAPIGAGQQSSQSTPMGVTGTPAGGSSATGSTAAGSTSGGSNKGSTNAGSSNMGSTSSGTSMGSSSTSADTSMTPRSAKRSKRMARADRN